MEKKRPQIKPSMSKTGSSGGWWMVIGAKPEDESAQGSEALNPPSKPLGFCRPDGCIKPRFQNSSALTRTR